MLSCQHSEERVVAWVSYLVLRGKAVEEVRTPEQRDTCRTRVGGIVDRALRNLGEGGSKLVLARDISLPVSHYPD